MVKDIRLSIAGFGLVGQRHAEAIRQSAGVKLVSIVEPEESGRSLAENLGVPCFDKLEDMLSAGGVDGVILSTPNSLHVEQGLACVSMGCPVLVEKPIATDSAEALKLVDAADKAQVPLLVGHHRRHNPLIQQAKALIDAGEIGEVRGVQATCWFYKPDSYFDQADWRKQKGAGPISVNLVHDVDLMRYLCGEVLSVRAVARRSIRGFENEDIAAALLEFATGAVGTVTVSDSIAAPWSWELTSSEYPVYPVTQESCYQIGGSKGSLSVPDLRLWKHGNGEPDWWSPISATATPRLATDPLVNQILNFRDVILGDASPVVSGMQGYLSLRVIEAIQKAAENGETIRLG